MPLKLLTRIFSPYRNVDDKKGYMSFISIGRKEDPTDKAMSMQIYLTPDLYSDPRA